MTRVDAIQEARNSELAHCPAYKQNSGIGAEQLGVLK
jgi:hypothetical protein